MLSKWRMINVIIPAPMDPNSAYIPFFPLLMAVLAAKRDKAGIAGNIYRAFGRVRANKTNKESTQLRQTFWLIEFDFQASLIPAPHNGTFAIPRTNGYKGIKTSFIYIHPPGLIKPVPK